MKYKTGVVIGKFLPFHRGHQFLIESALAQVEHLTIIVCQRPTDFVDGTIRAGWVQELFPHAHVLLIDDGDHYTHTDSALWARLTVDWLGYVPEVAFTSESYGVHWAREMGCTHVSVDFERQTVPISGTQIRADVRGNFAFLTPPAREFLAQRICVLGAESSGSTTLSQALAAHFDTLWVEEYGRRYSAEKQARGDSIWHSDEFAFIAQEQTSLENAAARACNGVLVCDTNAFATRLWHYRYMEFWSPAVEDIARASKMPDLTVLTDIDIPFVQDGLRDGEHLRAHMHEQFIQELENWGGRWILVSGDVEARVNQVLASLNF